MFAQHDLNHTSFSCMHEGPSTVLFVSYITGSSMRLFSILICFSECRLRSCSTPLLTMNSKKRKSSVGSNGNPDTAKEPSVQGARASGRANKGKGGQAEQLTKVGNAITQTQKPPRKKLKDSMEEPVNPMVPDFGSQKGSHSGKQTSKVFFLPLSLVFIHLFQIMKLHIEGHGDIKDQ